MKQKRLTDNQSDLVATFLPKKLRQNRKLNASVKLVLANIYQLYYFDNNIGKRTVFRTREDFMRDIGAKDKNEIQRPHAVLIQNELVNIKIGVRGRATEYTLNDELYQMLPKQIRGEVSEKFKGAFDNKSTLLDEGKTMQINNAINCALYDEIIDYSNETPNSNTLKTNDLQKSEMNIISPSRNKLSHSGLQHSYVPSDTETDTESKTKTKNMVHESEVPCTEEVTSEVDKASASSSSFSFLNFEKDLASAHGASANNLISAEVTTISAESTHDSKPISADTSTEEVLSSEADVISTSSKDNLSTADRLTYPQPLVKALTPNSAAPLSQEKQQTNPQVEEFIKRVKQAIRKGVYDWSLTLDDMPDFLTGDDINSVVAPALRQQPDVEEYLGQFQISGLSSFAQDLMENRLKNKDIPTIIRQNRFKKKHSNSSVNDDDDLANENVEAPDANINQSLTAEPSTKIDDDIEEDLPF